MEDHWYCRIEEEHLSPGILEDVIKWMYLLPIQNMVAKVTDLLAAAEYFQVSRIISVAEPRFFGWSRWAGADLKFELEPIFFGATPAPFFWQVKNEIIETLKMLIFHCIGTVLYVHIFV